MDMSGNKYKLLLESLDYHGLKDLSHALQRASNRSEDVAELQESITSALDCYKKTHITYDHHNPVDAKNKP